jgi:hypothetical protein
MAGQIDQRPQDLKVYSHVLIEPPVASVVHHQIS